MLYTTTGLFLIITTAKNHIDPSFTTYNKDNYVKTLKLHCVT